MTAAKRNVSLLDVLRHMGMDEVPRQSTVGEKS